MSAAPEPPFRTLLVANRGEIAVRIIRGARDLGIRTATVYSDADVSARHVRLADVSERVGGPEPAESYLNAEAVLAAAGRMGADAVHPGYGFLSENADFARACRDAGIAFVGPSPEAIELMGDKIASRRTMQAAGVPIIPGTVDPVSDPAEVRAIAEEIGYPIALKASAGGGGRGIRVVESPDEIDRAISQAQDEARTAFGNEALFVEKLIRPARHIEIQVLADKQGNRIALGERDCSVQRRRQKLIEEAPAPGMTEELRARMEEAAILAADACGYDSAGTVEFLVWGDQFAFLEMNTRLQVEHPVTELVRGVDLVQDQIRIAAGEAIGYTAEERPIRGWSLECRITAEDPYRNFMPSVGPIAWFREPGGPGVRLDSMLARGVGVSPYYDSLIGKLITYGESREQCIRRMQRALGEYLILGVSTSIPFHQAMLASEAFLSGGVDTDYVEAHPLLSEADRPCSDVEAAVAGALFFHTQGEIAEQQRGIGLQRRAWSRSGRGRRFLGEQGWRRTTG